MAQEPCSGLEVGSTSTQAFAFPADGSDWGASAKHKAPGVKLLKRRSITRLSLPLPLARQLDTSDLANKPMQRAEPLQWSFLQANFPKAGPGAGKFCGTKRCFAELSRMRFMGSAREPDGLLIARHQIPAGSLSAGGG